MKWFKRRFPLHDESPELVELQQRLDTAEITAKILTRRLDHLEATVPGKCGQCGRMTDSPDEFWCGESCRQHWNEHRTNRGKVA